MDFKFNIGDKVHYIFDEYKRILPDDVGTVISVKLGAITNKPFITVEWNTIITQHYENELVHVAKQKSGFAKFMERTL